MSMFSGGEKVLSRAEVEKDCVSCVSGLELIFVLVERRFVKSAEVKFKNKLSET